MDLCLWKKIKWENTDKKVVESCHRDKREVCTEEEEDISIIKRGKRRCIWVHWKTIEKRVY